jgi:hypothetical protein
MPSLRASTASSSSCLAKRAVRKRAAHKVQHAPVAALPAFLSLPQKSQLFLPHSRMLLQMSSSLEDSSFGSSC